MSIIATKPLVSIVCTTFNHAKYIRDAFESFLMQKTTFPIEVIVHDDASTDSTAEIIREYEVAYPQLFKCIYRTENWYSQGKNIWSYLFSECCNGQYIAICEGDDCWIDPLKLQKQIDFLEANLEYSMCFHNAVKYYDDEKKRVELFNLLQQDCDLSLHDVVHDWLIPTASMVGRREVFAHYPEWLSQIYSGDYSLILLSFHAGKIHYINRIMSMYRINTTGTSATAIMLKRNIFMLEQKIQLLDSFNNGTNKRYAYEIESRIKYLKRESRFQKAKENRNLYLILMNIDMCIVKLLKKNKR